MVDQGVPPKRSRANTRARLLDGAAAAFAERGFQAAKVEDVCAAAGFTRGAFYSNFASKDDLFLALWDRQADRIVDTVALLHAGVIDGTVTSEAAIELLTSHELYDRQWFVLNAEFLLHALRSPAAAQQLAAHRVRLRAGIGAVFEAVLDAKGQDLPDGLDVERATRMLIAAYEGAQNQTRIEPDAPDPFRATVELLLAACRPSVSRGGGGATGTARSGSPTAAPPG